MNAISSSEHLKVQVSYPAILRLALPISMAILIPQLNFIINTIFLGHYDIKALAVAGITGVYYLIFGSIGFGLNNGLQALISRRAGENRPEEIGKLFRQGIFVALGISAVAITITYLFLPYLFSQFITDVDRLKQAIAFLKIRIWGLPFLYLYQMRNSLLVGTNQSQYLLYGTLAEALVNVAMDYALIFGHWGFPEMGMMGSAYASILAELTGLVVVFGVIQYNRIGDQFQLFRGARWDSDNFKLILRMSGPLIFQHAISIISWEYFFLEIDAHGERDLAISNTMRTLFGLFGCVSWALAATSNAMISNVIGQQKKRLLWLLLRKISWLSVSFSVGAAILLNLFPAALMALYGQPEAFVEAAIPVIRVVSLAMILMSFSTVFLNAVTGTGNSAVTFAIEVSAIILYGLYVYIVVDQLFLPIYIGWMSEWVYWSSIFAACYLYLRSGRWKKTVL